jgi:hypothetical protein
MEWGSGQGAINTADEGGAHHYLGGLSFTIACRSCAGWESTWLVRRVAKRDMADMLSLKRARREQREEKAPCNVTRTSVLGVALGLGNDASSSSSNKQQAANAARPRGGRGLIGCRAGLARGNKGSEGPSMPRRGLGLEDDTSRVVCIQRRRQVKRRRTLMGAGGWWWCNEAQCTARACDEGESKQAKREGAREEASKSKEQRTKNKEQIRSGFGFGRSSIWRRV